MTIIAGRGAVCGPKTLVWRFGQTRTDGGKEKQASLEYVSLDSLAQIVPNRPKAVHMLQCCRCSGWVVGPSRAVSLAARSCAPLPPSQPFVFELTSLPLFSVLSLLHNLPSHFSFPVNLTSLTLTINTQIMSSFLNPANFDRCAWYGSHRCCLPPMISIYYLSDFVPLGRHPHSRSPNARCH